VDVGGALFDGLKQHLVDITHHWRIVDIACFDVIVIVILLAPQLMELNIAHLAQRFINTAPLLGEEVFYALQQFIVLNQYRLNIQARLEANFCQGVLVGGVAHREDHAIALF